MYRTRLKSRMVDTFGYFNSSELKHYLENSDDLASFKVVLEIGSYEGVFSCYAAEHFAMEVHTVDPFLVTDQGTRMSNLTERNFHRNLSNSTAVSKIFPYKMLSSNFFLNNNLLFDLIYIDGSHESEVVLQDLNSSLSFCRQGGIIWIDDFRSDYKDLHVTIFSWLNNNISNLEIIHQGYQLGVKKK